jgi:ATP synthase F1 delta subunit
MTYNPVIMSYANAIFEASKKINSLNQTLEKLELVSSLIEDNPNLSKALKAPVIYFDEKSKVIYEISTKLGFNSAIKNFLLLLAKNKRFNCLKQIIIAVNDLIMKENGIVEATITSAKDLSEEDFIKVQNFLSTKYNKNFMFTKSVDNSLIGGLTVEFDNKLLDASVQGALKKFKNKSKEIISVL